MIGLTGSPVRGIFGRTKAGVGGTAEEDAAGNADALGTGVALAGAGGSDGATEEDALTAVDSFVDGGALHPAMAASAPTPISVLRIVLTNAFYARSIPRGRENHLVGTTSWRGESARAIHRLART